MRCPNPGGGIRYHVQYRRSATQLLPSAAPLQWEKQRSGELATAEFHIVSPASLIAELWTGAPIISSLNLITPWTEWVAGGSATVPLRGRAFWSLDDSVRNNPNGPHPADVGLQLHQIKAEEQIVRLTASAPVPTAVTRHFIRYLRERSGVAVTPWTYKTQEIVSLTIPAGGTVSTITQPAQHAAPFGAGMLARRTIELD